MKTSAFGLLAACILRIPAGGAAPAPAEPIEVGAQRQLFVDPYLIDQITGQAELRLHHPEPQAVALIHDAPWEGNGSGYHNIFQDGGRYRMYYRGNQQYTATNGRMVTTKAPAVLCYAESDDGIHWRKPELGLVEFHGSKANNIVLRSGQIGAVFPDADAVAVFKDGNPQAGSDAIYKAIFRSRQPKGLLPFKSADGLHWVPMSDHPVITAGAFDSQNLAFWDEGHQEYRAYWRYFSGGGDWKPGAHRAIRTATSPDLLHWGHQADLAYVDSPSEQLYTSQIKPYYRAPSLFLGFPTRYVERGSRDGRVVDANPGVGPERAKQWAASLRALPELEHRILRASVGEREGTALTEGLIMASHDGVTFKRWNEAFLRPGIERPGTWNYGQQYIGWQMVETKSPLEGAPNEISLYATERYSTSNLGSVLRRYTLRLDGFVSVEAPLSGGEFVTRPLRLSGKHLALNFATSAAGTVRVEIQDRAGKPLPGFALADCAPLFGDTVERTVTWTSGSDVSSLAGRPIRLRFTLQDADVYAFQFKE